MSLQVTYEPVEAPQGDPGGFMTASIEHDGYAATTTVWVDRHLVDRFASQISAFPIQQEPAPVLLGGPEPLHRHPETLEFRLRVLPIGSSGRLVLEAFMARNDFEIGTQKGTIRMPVEYQALADFANQLRAILLGSPETASLTAA